MQQGPPYTFYPFIMHAAAQTFKIYEKLYIVELVEIICVLLTYNSDRKE